MFLTKHPTRRLATTLVALLLGVLVLGALLPSAEAQAGPDDTFTIVVIPDTQVYVQSDEGTESFAAQFQWIADNMDARNIEFVTHVGDVAQDPSSVTEWDRIEGVYAILEATGLPHGISPGNHDINADATAPEYDARFGVERYASEPWFGGNHAAEGNRSSYQTISVPGHELLFLHLRHLVPEYGSVDDVVAWADGVLGAHPDHLTFVTTHEFTEFTGEILHPELQTLIASHCTVAAVFSGHRPGAAAGTFDDQCGRTVHHLLTNYQFIPDGGQGFLRTVEIDRLTLEASFEVYSPVFDTFGTTPPEQFTALLAPLVPVVGDPSCNRQLSIADAVLVAQYIVGNRTAHQSCPLPNSASELNVTSADANNDGAITIADAVIIAQCTAGLQNVLCPG